jgi:hypothetical protein
MAPPDAKNALVCSSMVNDVSTAAGCFLFAVLVLGAMICLLSFEWATIIHDLAPFWGQNCLQAADCIGWDHPLKCPTFPIVA